MAKQQKTAPLACQRSTGAVFAKATTVPFDAATAIWPRSYTADQTT